MLDKLKNMEPLSPQEENRIMWKLRAVVLVMAGLVLAFAIWSIVKKRDFTAVYYVIVSVFLFCNWFLIDVAPAFLCRALAGRSDKKVNAFLKMAGLGLLDDRPHTSNGEGFLNMFCPDYKGGKYYIDRPAVRDGNLITAGSTGGLLMAKLILEYLDVFRADTLESWYTYFSTGDPQAFFSMMQSIQ